jgi:hypothetical protein
MALLRRVLAGADLVGPTMDWAQELIDLRGEVDRMIL